MKPNPHSHTASQLIPNFSTQINTEEWRLRQISQLGSHMFHVNILARNYILFGGKIIIERVRYYPPLACITHTELPHEISLHPPPAHVISSHQLTSAQCITIITPPYVVSSLLVTLCCTPSHSHVYTGADNYLLILYWTEGRVTTCFKLSRLF